MHLKNHKITIGVDLMGGDNPPHQLLEAIINFAESFQGDVDFLVLGTEPLAKELDHFKSKFRNIRKNMSIHVSGQPIQMDDNPLLAIRKKKNSSLCIGMRLLRDQQIDAFVSPGNTGALISSAKLYLKMIPGILRPALLASLPTKKEPVAVLDVGANVDVKAEHLIQFAQMGASYKKAQGIKKPVVGLLNIGTEKLKGTSAHRKVYHELENERFTPKFQFAGNIEGKEVFEGNVDVLITDGFTGNVFLKTAEGIANLVMDKLEALDRPHFEKIGDVQKHLHYAEYPGAILLGVNGLVIKCHGYSTPQAYISAVKGAIRLAQSRFELEIF